MEQNFYGKHWILEELMDTHKVCKAFWLVRLRQDNDVRCLTSWNGTQRRRPSNVPRPHLLHLQILHLPGCPIHGGRRAGGYYCLPVMSQRASIHAQCKPPRRACCSRPYGRVRPQQQPPSPPPPRPQQALHAARSPPIYANYGVSDLGTCNYWKASSIYLQNPKFVFVHIS